MPKIICTLPNASEEISGVKFQPHPDREGVMVSEDVAEDVASRFCSIPGYELLAVKPAVDADDKARDREEKDALLKRAEELKITVSARWGLEKLRETVAAAEKAGGNSSETDNKNPADATSASAPAPAPAGGTSADGSTDSF